jgi:very-short-patch-repair endonuclease
MPPRPAVPDHLRLAPFTLAQAAAAGVTPTALQSAPWRRVFHGVWAHVDLEDTRDNRLAAARLVIPRHGILCGLTAAWIYQADVRRENDFDVHVGFPEGKRIRNQPGLVVSQETLSSSDIWTIAGVAVTSPVRTAYDCLRLLRGRDRLVVADALTHLGATTVDELRRYFATQRRMRNLRIAQRLLDDVEPKSESPMETRLRIVLVDGGLSRPEAQWEIADADGVVVWRLDLAYPTEMVAVEYDGAWHWKQRRDDDRRRAALRALGWDVHVFDFDDVYGDPDRVVEVTASKREFRGAAHEASREAGSRSASAGPSDLRGRRCGRGWPAAGRRPRGRAARGCGPGRALRPQAPPPALPRTVPSSPRRPSPRRPRRAIPRGRH